MSERESKPNEPFNAFIIWGIVLLGVGMAVSLGAWFAVPTGGGDGDMLSQARQSADNLRLRWNLLWFADRCLIIGSLFLVGGNIISAVRAR